MKPLYLWIAMICLLCFCEATKLISLVEALEMGRSPYDVIERYEMLKRDIAETYEPKKGSFLDGLYSNDDGGKMERFVLRMNYLIEDARNGSVSYFYTEVEDEDLKFYIGELNKAGYQLRYIRWEKTLYVSLEWHEKYNAINLELCKESPRTKHGCNFLVSFNNLGHFLRVFSLDWTAEQVDNYRKLAESVRFAASVI